VPTLTIGAAHDIMDPKQMAAMARAFPQGTLPPLSRRQPHGNV